MNIKFEEWRSKTAFSQESFFASYVRYIESLNLSLKPSVYYSWFQLKRVKSTPLMSRLNYTTPYKQQRIDSIIISIGAADIVVIHELPDEYASISRQGGSWTMTSLKRDGLFAFPQIDEDRACCSIHWSENKCLKIWSAPLHLRAVTNGDKDFRKEYMGGVLVYEGNEYGDTSDFYIIGTLIDK